MSEPVTKEAAPAPPELIAELRDYALEVYLRRLPQAAPEPGTSLYAIIEASAVVWATFLYNSDDAARMLDGLRQLVANDRAELIQPPPSEVEDFYKPLQDHDGQQLRVEDNPEPGSAPGTGCIL